MTRSTIFPPGWASSVASDIAYGYKFPGSAGCVLQVVPGGQRFISNSVVLARKKLLYPILIPSKMPFKKIKLGGRIGSYYQAGTIQYNAWIRSGYQFDYDDQQLQDFHLFKADVETVGPWRKLVSFDVLPFQNTPIYTIPDQVVSANLPPGPATLLFTAFIDPLQLYINDGKVNPQFIGVGYHSADDTYCYAYSFYSDLIGDSTPPQVKGIAPLFYVIGGWTPTVTLIG